MLQELDQVAVRVGQVVALSHQLITERSALIKRLENAETVGVNLRQQLSERDTAVAELNERIQALDTEYSVTAVRVQEQNTALQNQVDSMSQELAQLKERLSKAESDLTKWRSSTQSVRARVAHVLENLPGSSAQGEA